MKKLILFFLLGLASCANNITHYGLKNPPSIGSNPHTGELYLGGFSGLDILTVEDDHLIAMTLTDRGPNTNSYDFDKDGIKDRGFLLPSFTPQLVKLKITASTIEVLEQHDIRLKSNKPALGLGNQAKWQVKASYDEAPFNIKRKPLKFVTHGLDPEGVVRDSKGNYWIVEEYGPSILKLSPNGVIQARFVPKIAKTRRWGTKVLPAIFGKRKLNRGFEGVTLIGNKLYAVLQSPIPEGNWKKEGICHLLEFDILKEKVTGHYLHLFKEGKGRKIGALSKTLDKKLLLLEQNGKLGSKSYKAIYKLNLSNATNLLEKSFNPKIKRSELASMGLTPAKAELFLNLDKGKIPNYEKVEGMSLLPNGDLYLIVDNDFGVGDLIDEDNGELKSVKIDKTSHLFRVKIK